MNLHEEVRSFLKNHFTFYSFPENNISQDTLQLFDTATLSSGNMMSATQHHYLLPYHTVGHLTDLLFVLNRKEKMMYSSMPMTIYIYREGESEAICTVTSEWDEDTINFLVSGTFEPDKYFIIIPNAYCVDSRGEFDEREGFLCFPFQVLRTEMAETHFPEPQHCCADWVSAGNGEVKFGYSGTIRLTLSMIEKNYSSNDQYSMLLTSKEGRILSFLLNADVRVNVDNVMNARLRFETKYSLFQEEHSIFLYKNGKPFFSFKLMLNEKETTVTHSGKIEQGSDVYEYACTLFYDKLNTLDENRFEANSPSGIVHWIQFELFNKGYWMTDGAEHHLSTLVKQNFNSDMPYDWNADSAFYYLDECILKPHNKRLVEEMEARLPEERELNKISRLDLEPFPEEYCESKNLIHCMDELNRLVGLNQVKETFKQTMQMVRFQKKRERLGLRTSTMNSHHMLFLGNPGTGKTTVAKLIGKMFKDMGILSDGGTMVLERKNLVKGFIGQTEERMLEILNDARGKVLFIDEAYSLIDDDKDRRDFGYRVIESLLTIMAEPNSDIVVIMAGYEKEMKRLLDTNAGLRGRFAHVFNFDDYSAEELMSMADSLLLREDYRLSPSARKRLQQHVDETLANKDEYFSNGRWINQYVQNGILVAMAERVMLAEETDDVDFYRTIEEEDVIKGYKEYRPMPKKELKTHRPIGFVA